MLLREEEELLLLLMDRTRATHVSSTMSTVKINDDPIQYPNIFAV
jgi:hypothetical protein